MTLEDFTTYIEVEGVGGDPVITKTANTAIYNGSFSYDSYLYKDKGDAYFKNFQHNFSCQIKTSTAGVNSAVWHMSNNIKSWGDTYNASEDGFAITMNRIGAGSYRIYIQSCSNQTASSYTISKDIIYYCTIDRAANSVMIRIYTDKDRLNLQDTLFLTTTYASFRYIYALSGYGSLAGASINIETYDLDLQDTCSRMIITGTTATLELNMPNSLSWDDSRGIKQFHFWNDVDSVIDIGKESESITLSGVLSSGVSMFFSEFDEIVEDGEEITLSGFDDDQLDTTWVVSDYSYTVTGGLPDVAEYNISLEKA